MVRNPTSCSSNLELVGIIPPSEPSPHWSSPRVASFFQVRPLVSLVPHLVLHLVIIHGG